MVEKAEQTLELLEVSHLKNKKIETMSSGEARRFLIARALVNSPKVLILDEPSNSLDIASAAKFHNTVRKICASGSSVIIVTHLVSDIVEINRFVLFKDGKIFADGDRKSVFNSETFSRLFGIDVKLTNAGEINFLTIGF